MFFPFQTTLHKNDAFDITIHGDIYGCLPRSGTTYYFVRFSFNNSFIRKHKLKYKFKLIFHQRPTWVRHNLITSKKELKKLGSLNIRYDRHQRAHICEDNNSDIEVSNIKVYTFHRNDH